MFRSIVWQMVREAQERRGSVVEVAEVLVAKAKDGQAPLQEKCKAKEDSLGKEHKIKVLSACPTSLKPFTHNP